MDGSFTGCFISPSQPLSALLTYTLLVMASEDLNTHRSCQEVFVYQWSVMTTRSRDGVVREARQLVVLVKLITCSSGEGGRYESQGEIGIS